MAQSSSSPFPPNGTLKRKDRLVLTQEEKRDARAQAKSCFIDSLRSSKVNNVVAWRVIDIVHHIIQLEDLIVVQTALEVYERFTSMFIIYYYRWLQFEPMMSDEPVVIGGGSSHPNRKKAKAKRNKTRPLFSADEIELALFRMGLLFFLKTKNVNFELVNLVSTKAPIAYSLGNNPEAIPSIVKAYPDYVRSIEEFFVAAYLSLFLSVPDKNIARILSFMFKWKDVSLGPIKMVERNPFLKHFCLEIAIDV